MKGLELGKRLARFWEEIPLGQTAISTEGRRQVLISGCEELLTYESNLVRVRTGGGVIGVAGEGLTLRAFRGNRILVDGHWEWIRWEEEV